jgi:hypothetical protein
MKPETSKFWTFLFLMMLVVSALVMLIDLGIKASILEESAKLRNAINHMGEECHDPDCPGVHYDRASKTNANGAANDGSYSSYLLGKFPAGMETGNVVAGDQREIVTRAARPVRRAKPRPAADNGEVPTGD